jgi:hypothetical protein
MLVTAKVPSSPILVILMMEALLSSETSVLKEKRGITSQKMAFFKYHMYFQIIFTGNQCTEQRYQ